MLIINKLFYKVMFKKSIHHTECPQTFFSANQRSIYQIIPLINNSMLIDFFIRNIPFLVINEQ